MSTSRSQSIPSDQQDPASPGADPFTAQHSNYEHQRLQQTASPLLPTTSLTRMYSIGRGVSLLAALQGDMPETEGLARDLVGEAQKEDKRKAASPWRTPPPDLNQVLERVRHQWPSPPAASPTACRPYTAPQLSYLFEPVLHRSSSRSPLVRSQTCRELNPQHSAHAVRARASFTERPRHSTADVLSSISRSASTQITTGSQSSPQFKHNFIPTETELRQRQRFRSVDAQHVCLNTESPQNTTPSESSVSLSTVTAPVCAASLGRYEHEKMQISCGKVGTGEALPESGAEQAMETMSPLIAAFQARRQKQRELQQQQLLDRKGSASVKRRQKQLLGKSQTMTRSEHTSAPDVKSGTGDTKQQGRTLTGSSSKHRLGSIRAIEALLATSPVRNKRKQRVKPPGPRDRLRARIKDREAKHDSSHLIKQAISYAQGLHTEAATFQHTASQGNSSRDPMCSGQLQAVSTQRSEVHGMYPPRTESGAGTTCTTNKARVGDTNAGRQSSHLKAPCMSPFSGASQPAQLVCGWTDTSHGDHRQGCNRPQAYTVPGSAPGSFSMVVRHTSGRPGLGTTQVSRWPISPLKGILPPLPSECTHAVRSVWGHTVGGSTAAEQPNVVDVSVPGTQSLKHNNTASRAQHGDDGACLEPNVMSSPRTVSGSTVTGLSRQSIVRGVEAASPDPCHPPPPQITPQIIDHNTPPVGVARTASASLFQDINTDVNNGGMIAYPGSASNPVGSAMRINGDVYVDDWPQVMTWGQVQLTPRSRAASVHADFASTMAELTSALRTSSQLICDPSKDRRIARAGGSVIKASSRRGNKDDTASIANRHILQ